MNAPPLGLMRPRPLAFGAVVALWLVLVGVVMLLVWNAWQLDAHEAKMRGTATTALLQAHTANIFNAVDNTLIDLTRSIQREKPARQDAQFRETMRSRLPAMPYVRALFMIGPDGHIQHDTDYPDTPDVSLADRPYFRQYAVGEAAPGAVSEPILSRSGTGWFVAVTHKIGEGAAFEGVAVAAIQLKYFADLYQKVGGGGNQILLFHRDGTLMAQYPADSGVIGKAYADYPLFQFHLQNASWGAYLTEDKPLPYPRVVNYAAVPNLPLVVAQVQNLQERRDSWKRALGLGGVGMLLLLGAMVYGTERYLRVRLARQRTRDRLVQSEKMEALGQLTGSIAHDFANILGIATTNIELLKRLQPSDGKFEVALARVTKALHNGTVMTRQLMSFARKRELQIASTDLNEAVASVMPLLEQAAGPQCKVSFEPADALRHCRLDRAQLETALINLVVNARHALEGPGQVTLATRNVAAPARHFGSRLRGRHPFVCLTVRDTGKGMTEDIRRRAMEPFFTTKGEQGTGLGLAQVFGLMQQLDGDLILESAPGAGTAVHLCFPTAPADGA